MKPQAPPGTRATSGDYWAVYGNPIGRGNEIGEPSHAGVAPAPYCVAKGLKRDQSRPAVEFANYLNFRGNPPP